MGDQQFTPEEQARVEKMALACENAASKGFLAQCKAAGMPDARAEKLHGIYWVQRERRANMVKIMRQAILGGQVEG